MTREEMIQLLILDRLEHDGDQQRFMWLQNILENGFCGFAKMSDEQLSRKVRALAALVVGRNAIAEADAGDWEEACADDASLLVHSFATERLRQDMG